MLFCLIKRRKSRRCIVRRCPKRTRLCAQHANLGRKIQQDDMVKYIKCGTLIDATGAAPMKNKVLMVERDRIVAVTNDGQDPPDGAEVVDLSRYTVMPGMIDCHEHLSLDVGDEAAQCAQPLPY